MAENIIDEAIELMRAARYAEALPLFQELIENEPVNWNVWYMAGQCCRFLNDIDGAVSHLSRAAQMGPDQPPIFLALGIAHQLNSQLGDAVEAFRRAIELDADKSSWMRIMSLRITALRLRKRKAAIWTKHCAITTRVLRPLSVEL